MKFVGCSGMEHMSASHPFAPQTLGARNSTMNQNALINFSFSLGVSLARRGLNPASHQFLNDGLTMWLGTSSPFLSNAFPCVSNPARMCIKKNMCEKCFCHQVVQACSPFYLLWRALPICVQDVFLA
jgi:hypothetical protein